MKDFSVLLSILSSEPVGYKIQTTYLCYKLDWNEFVTEGFFLIPLLGTLDIIQDFLTYSIQYYIPDIIDVFWPQLPIPIQPM